MSKGRRIARLPYLLPDLAVAKKYFRQWEASDLYNNPEDFATLTTRMLFQKEGPLTIEIGCGSGEFLVGLARENRDEYFVGIEVSGRSAYFAVDLAHEARLDNCMILRADIHLLLPLFAPESLNAVYLLFPDPNYGAKHLKKRVLNQKFLDAMSIALEPEATLTVVTDEEEFFMDMLATAEADSRFTKQHPERYLSSFEPTAKTRFQKTWERRGKPVFRMDLGKKGSR